MPICWCLHAVPVAQDGNELPPGTPFQLPAHDPRWLNVVQPWPAGDWEELSYRIDGRDEWLMPVAGVASEGRQHVIAAMIRGSGLWVDLLREPSNPADPAAIAVIGHWTNRRGQAKKGRLGYLPAEVAGAIADRYPHVDVAARLVSIFQPTCFHNGGLRVAVGVPADAKVRRTRNLPGVGAAMKRGRRSSAKPRRSSSKGETGTGGCGCLMVALFAVAALVLYAASQP